MSKQLKEYTREEVAQHNTPDDLWIIVDAKVYNVSRFKDLHPGGAAVFLEEDIRGQDATETFFGLHLYEVLEKPQYQRLVVGTLKDEKPVLHGRISGALSEIPYAEPTWLTKGYHSPYYKESHRKLQEAVRKFTDEILYQDGQARELDGKPPSQVVFDKMAEVNLHAMRMGPGKHLKGLTLMNGIVSPEELVITQEVVRTAARGYGDGMNAGTVIGLPPILNFGSPELKAKIVPEVFSGKKHICLAVSEAHAGSDVFGLQTTATKTEDGKHWIINGHKKWITNGTEVLLLRLYIFKYHYQDGFTVILVERQEGVETKPIKTSYSPSAGTALVTFDNVKVPVENTLGEEGGGIFVMLSNFNHERWVMCCSSARSQRLLIEACMQWIHQRKAFGKPLASLAVIRSKMANMIARAESIQSWLENITYQMCHMVVYKEQAKTCWPIAFLKMYSTRAAQQTAIDAVQILSGMGRLIEHYYRTVPFDAYLEEVSEDVLADLGVRQAMRGMPENARL
ncbi:acyl-CoA dehydrogenase/oxidase [Irpex lacteus]|nr:acyl-CoA dehydrogenase/oxidase [Irpex lacteus]